MPVSLVSVIVPTYNGLPDLDQQLASLASQDYVGEFEVIVSDNGSTDATREHLRVYESTMNVRWIDSSGTKGASHARNAGIDAARGEFLAFTDHDDAVYPNWLTALTHAADNFDALGGPVEVHSLNTSEVASWREPPEPGQRFETVYLPYAKGTNFAMWRRVVNEVGYFDEELTGGGEDVDYSWRIQQSGLTLGHVPGAMVAYRLRTTVRATFEQGVGYGSSAWPVLLKHRAHGSPSQPALLAIAANFASIVYLMAAKNPLLPKVFGPFPSGRWAHSIGAQYGALRTRLRILCGTIFRRRSK